MALLKKTILFFLFFTFSLTSYSAEVDSSLDVVEKVEKNLIYSKEIIKPDEAEDIVIKKGAWTQEDTKNLEEAGLRENKIVSNVKKTKEDKNLIALKRKAFDAISVGQYEIAVKLYKDVLNKNKEDVYAMLGLATAYQYLGQYTQAKPIYLKVIEIIPNDQQVMANLLAIVTEETPYEAVYLLSNIADKNLASPLIQAQTSIAYSRVKNYDKAIEYIKRAIELDDSNLEYKYNLAVLYDMNQNYDLAKSSYNNLLFLYSQKGETDYNLPLRDIQDRLNTLNSKKFKK